MPYRFCAFARVFPVFWLVSSVWLLPAMHAAAEDDASQDDFDPPIGKCFNYDLSLIGLSRDGKYAVFFEIEQPSSQGPAIVVELANLKTLAAGGMVSDFELEQGEWSFDAVIPRELQKRWQLLSLAAWKELEIRSDDATADITLGSGGASLERTIQLASFSGEPFKLKTAYASQRWVALVFAFDNQADCGSMAQGETVVVLPRKQFAAMRDVEHWSQQIDRADDLLKKIAKEVYKRAHDALTAAWLTGKMLERADVRSQQTLRFAVISDRLLYLSRLGLLGQVTCIKEADAALADPTLAAAEHARVRSAIEFNRKQCEAFDLVH